MDTNSDIINVPCLEMHPSSDKEENCSNQLKECVENDSKVEAKNRVAFMLGVGSLVFDAFMMESYQEESFKSYKGKKNKPTR